MASKDVVGLVGCGRRSTIKKMIPPTMSDMATTMGRNNRSFILSAKMKPIIPAGMKAIMIFS